MSAARSTRLEHVLDQVQDHSTLPYFREALLYLSLAGILIPLLQRLRVSQVLGFLAVGTLVGPFGIGLWADQLPWLRYFTFTRVEGVAALGNLGVLFLMFTIGLEVSPARLSALRYWVFGAGTAQVCLSAAILGSLAFLFGNRIETAVILGFVLSMSSTAVVMQLLSERHALGSRLGEAALSILMLQDLAVVPLLIILNVLTKGEDANLIPAIALALAKSVGAILLIYLWGRRVIRPLFLFSVREHHPDVFMALILLSTLGIAGITAAAGLSMALGAFLAGLVLAETEFRYEVEVTIEPFEGLLLGLFFMTVGMQLDVREVARAPASILLSVVGLFVIKASVLAVIFRIGRFNWGRAVEGGLLLGQGGEFAFIVVGYAISISLLAPSVGQFIMLVVGLSLFATPLMAKAGRAFGDWWERRQHEQAENALPQPIENQVVIAGFGSVGQMLAHVLTEQNIPYIAIEIDSHLVAQLHVRGYPVYLGNAARTALLRRVHAESASAVAVTMNHTLAPLQTVKAVRRINPQTAVVARARDEKHALELKQAGATLVIPETLESALQLASFVLQTLGLAEETAEHVVGIERDRRLALLREDEVGQEQALKHAGGIDESGPHVQ